MGARQRCARHRRRLGLPVAALALGSLMGGCSDPSPALTGEQFHAQAGEIYTEVFGEGVNTWPQLQDTLGAHSQMLEEIDRPFRDDLEVAIDDWPTIQIDLVRFGALPRPGLDNARRALEQIAVSGILEEADRALDSTACHRVWNEAIPVYDAFGDGLEVMGQMRSLGRTNLALLRIAATDEDGDATLRAVNRQLGLARASSSRLLYLDDFSGVGTVLTTLTELRSLALEGHLDPETCLALLDRLEQPILPPLKSVLAIERLFSLATFADSAAKSGTRIHRQRLIDAIDACFVEATAAIDEPYGAAFDVLSLEAMTAAVLDEESSEAEDIRLMRSSAGRVIRNRAVLRLHVAATRTVLLIELYQHQHGDYPASLGLIDPPTDPITGGSFVYRLTPDSPDGMPYLLYSTGVDGVDNGGQEKPATGLTFADPSDTGYDYVLCKPRRPVPED